MRRSIAFRSIVLFAAVMALGCRSTGIESSSKDPTYNKTVQKLFVLADLPTKGWMTYLEFGKTNTMQEAYLIHSKAFKNTLESLFKKNGIECECEVLTGLELDDVNYEGKRKTFSPDAYAVVDCTSITLRGGRMEQENYDISLIDYPSEKKVWRAKAEYHHMTDIHGKGLAVKIFYSIVQGLKDDGLNVLGIIEPAGDEK